MDWPTFTATLVGAGVSIATSLVVFGATFYVTRKTHERDGDKEKAFAAYTGLLKTLHTANACLNIQRHIDECFSRAAENNVEVDNPAEIVTEIVAIDLGIEYVAAEESAFLLAIGEAQLLFDVLEFQQRVAAHETTLKRYNEMRLEFQQFVDSNADEVIEGEGTMVSLSFSAQSRSRASVKIGVLNNMIGTLIEQLERDGVSAKSLVQRYHDAANEHFGDMFPRIQISWDE